MPTTYGSFDPNKFYIDHEEEQRKKTTVIVVAIAAVLCVVLVVGQAIRMARYHPAPPGPPIIPAITNFMVLSSPTQVYKIDVPSGWIYRNGGDGGMVNAEGFIEKGAVVMVVDDGSASTQDDITPGQINAAAADNPVFKPMMTQVNPDGSEDDGDPAMAPGETTLYYEHQAGRIFAHLLGHSREGDPTPLDTGLGPAYVSQFVIYPGKNGKLPWKMRGYRETVLTDTRRVTVMCMCPDIDWQTMQPGFWHIITSLDHD